MPEFIYTFRPKRRDFVQTMTDAERQTMREHTQHLVTLHSRGELLFAGPCLDGAFALAAFTAESPEHAARIFNADPAVRAGIVQAELHPFHLSFLIGRTPTLFV